MLKLFIHFHFINLILNFLRPGELHVSATQISSSMRVRVPLESAQKAGPISSGGGNGDALLVRALALAPLFSQYLPPFMRAQSQNIIVPLGPIYVLGFPGSVIQGCLDDEGRWSHNPAVSDGPGVGNGVPWGKRSEWIKGAGRTCARFKVRDGESFYLLLSVIWGEGSRVEGKRGGGGRRGGADAADKQRATVQRGTRAKWIMTKNEQDT